MSLGELVRLSVRRTRGVRGPSSSSLTSLEIPRQWLHVRVVGGFAQMTLDIFLLFCRNLDNLQVCAWDERFAALEFGEVQEQL